MVCRQASNGVYEEAKEEGVAGCKECKWRSEQCPPGCRTVVGRPCQVPQRRLSAPPNPWPAICHTMHLTPRPPISHLIQASQREPDRACTAGQGSPIPIASYAPRRPLLATSTSYPVGHASPTLEAMMLLTLTTSSPILQRGSASTSPPVLTILHGASPTTSPPPTTPPHPLPPLAPHSPFFHLTGM